MLQKVHDSICLWDPLSGRITLNATSRMDLSPISGGWPSVLSRASLRLLAPVTAALASALVAISAVNAAPAPGSNTAGGQEDARSYDGKLMRLAELLGSIHYLRELCGANEGQFWRDTMQELMKSEGFTAGRQARLTASFNQGYRSYSRTYNVCTPTARTAINRFLSEGAEIADILVRTAP